MKKVYGFDKNDYTVEVNKKSNRNSPKSEKSSSKIKTPLTSFSKRDKPTKPNSNGGYFNNKKAKMPEDAEVEARIKRFLEKEDEYL